MNLQEIVEDIKNIKVDTYNKIDLDRKHLELETGYVPDLTVYHDLIDELDECYEDLEDFAEQNPSNKKVHVAMQSVRNTKKDINVMIDEVKHLGIKGITLDY